MTGFGKAEVVAGTKKITCEIRSLNSKQLDISQLRIPIVYKEKEHEIRNLISGQLERGKIDVYISFDVSEEASAPTINRSVFKSYYQQITEISAELSIPVDNEPLIQSILRLPEVFKSQQEEITQEEWDALMQGVTQAIANVNKFREQEGEITKNDLLGKVSKIESLLGEVPLWETERISTVKERLLDGLNKIKQDVNADKNRFEQEIIYYLERMDVNEEKVRLANHCKYFYDTINSSESVGRKLGFIAQEMGREINTLGSKANHVQIQKLVVQMKDELEKIKEQLLNIL